MCPIRSDGSTRGAALSKGSSSEQRRLGAAGRPVGQGQAGARVAGARLGTLEADALHRLLEEEAVLGHVDGLELGANELHAVLLERPSLHAAVGGDRGGDRSG